MRYNLSKIMLKAWKITARQKASILLKHFIELGYLLRQKKSMQRESKLQNRQQESPSRLITFTKWKEAGYKVIHGSKALFGAVLIWGSRGDGAEYKASFFGKSQVEPI